MADDIRVPQDHKLSGSAIIRFGSDDGPLAWLTSSPDLFYFTGKPCPRGHVAPRYRSNHACTECLRASTRAAYHREPERHNQRNRERLKTNPELNRRQSERWLRANPLKAAVMRANAHAARYGAPGTFTAEDAQAILERDGCCLACGSEVRLTLDHVVPLGRGGSNTADNLQTLCLLCNQQKHTKSIDYRKKGTQDAS